MTGYSRRRRRQAMAGAVFGIVLMLGAMHYYFAADLSAIDALDVLDTDCNAPDYDGSRMNGRAEVHDVRTNSSDFEVFSLQTDKLQVVGVAPSKKVFLTIGIPSIRRDNGAVYLLETLASIVAQTTPAEKNSSLVLVFLADFNRTFNREVLSSIMEQFGDHIQHGFIQVIQATPDIYPPLDKLKRNFGDPGDRVHWRAKQNIDFALMFRYASPLSHYYIQLEDDVTCASHFIEKIREFIQFNRKKWTVLEFSELGFIGKLLKASDLERLSAYLVMFYDEQPVDWLIRYYRLTRGQRDPILRKPTLFQHWGRISSMRQGGRGNNPLVDKFFLPREWWRENDTDLQPHYSRTVT